MALIDLSQKAARHMKDRGAGQILQISSVLGFVGIAESAVYVASKHAVNGLVKSLRYELAGTGVRVWAACPGRTVSEFSEVAGRGAPRPSLAGTGADGARRAGDRARPRRPARVRPADLAGLAGRDPGLLAPRPVRLADGRVGPGVTRRRRNVDPDIGSLTERTKCVPFPWAFRLARGLGVGLLGIVECRDGPAPTSQTAQTTRIRAVGAGLGRRSVPSWRREAELEVAFVSLIPSASAASASARSSMRLRVRRAIGPWSSCP